MVERYVGLMRAILSQNFNFQIFKVVKSRLFKFNSRVTVQSGMEPKTLA